MSHSASDDLIFPYRCLPLCLSLCLAYKSIMRRSCVPIFKVPALTSTLLLLLFPHCLLTQQPPLFVLGIHRQASTEAGGLLAPDTTNSLRQSFRVIHKCFLFYSLCLYRINQTVFSGLWYQNVTTNPHPNQLHLLLL